MDARAFARRTRRGVVRREVREAHGGEATFRRRGAPVSNETLQKEAATYVVPDTNIVLHQLDVLEHSDVKCDQLDRLVICRTVAEEVRAVLAHHVLVRDRVREAPLRRRPELAELEELARLLCEGRGDLRKHGERVQ